MKQFMKKSVKNERYTFITAAGIVLTLLFCGEIGMHYQNIGSLSGAVIGVCLTAYGIAGWNRSSLTKTGLALFRIAKPIGLLVGGIILLTIGFMIFAVPKTQPEKDATVIILGCGVDSDGTPSAVMQKRVDAALDYLRDHPDVPVIVSGGQLGSAPVSEAESMKQELMRHGVDEERIYCEDQSRTTAENLRFSAKIIEDRHLSETVAVVTSEFHLARACLCAKRNGLHPSPVRAATPWYCLPAYVLREVYAVFDAFVIHRI